MLNPIEEVFSIWKGSIRKILANKYKEEAVLIGQKTLGIRTMFRRDLIVKIVNEASVIVTPGKVLSFENHSKKFHNDCEDRKDL